MKIEFDQCGVAAGGALNVRLWLRTATASYGCQQTASLTPAEARLVAQTLIAAADVAERVETMEAT